MTPSNRFAYGDWFEDSESDITIKGCLNFLLPVKRDWDSLVMGNRSCIRMNVHAHGGHIHEWEGLMGADIECR